MEEEFLTRLINADDDLEDDKWGDDDADVDGVNDDVVVDDDDESTDKEEEE
jgi:hypothetical protein